LKHNISVAHSPDADDIFMYYAIKFGWISVENTKFDNIALDIETLNKEALKNSYDISAISFGMYPKIQDEYALLRCAVSFGEGYGPKVVKRKGVKLKRNFKVALSGENTTNAMLFKIYFPDARIVYKRRRKRVGRGIGNESPGPSLFSNLLSSSEEHTAVS